MTPTADEIREARHAAGQTQAKAAQVARVSLITWKQYEAGTRSPHPALWELYLLESGQHPTRQITEKQPAD